jgi:hypothetical protein
MVLFILGHICIGGEMLKHYDIPDPFETFVAKKYANAKGYVHDFFTGEWSYRCLSCKDDMSAPSRKIMTKIRLYHTRNECLGGY